MVIWNCVTPGAPLIYISTRCQHFCSAVPNIYQPNPPEVENAGFSLLGTWVQSSNFLQNITKYKITKLSFATVFLLYADYVHQDVLSCEAIYVFKSYKINSEVQTIEYSYTVTYRIKNKFPIAGYTEYSCSKLFRCRLVQVMSVIFRLSYSYQT